MIVQGIGWFGFVMAILAFVGAWLQAYIGNNEKAHALENQCIGFLILTAICFK